jgi:hypothetical protein
MTEDNMQTSEPLSKRLSYFITITACLLALVHLARPLWAIDTVTLVLLVLAVLPWLGSIFRKLKVSDWFEVEYQDLKRQVKNQKQKTEELETSLHTKTQQLTVEVKQVAARDEYRASLVIQMQKLLFLTNRHQLELERYLRDETQLRKLISEATARFPDDAVRIKSVTPDPTNRAVYEEFLEESHKSQAVVDELIKLTSDPRLKEMPPELLAQISHQIEITEKQLAVTKNANAETEKVVETWRRLLSDK